MIIPNVTGVVLLEVTAKGEGRTLQPIVRELMIVGWAVDGGHAVPVTLGQPAPGAYVLLQDKRTATYLAIDGTPFADYRAALLPFWAMQDAEPAQEPAPPEPPAPALTEPSIGPVIGAPSVDTWHHTTPPHRQRQRQYPRE